MLRDVLVRTIEKAVKDEFGPAVSVQVLIEHPSNSSWGDFSTNVAMTASKSLKQNPLDIANKICSRLVKTLDSARIEGQEYNFLESVSVAPPGFINFKIDNKWLQNNLQNVISNKNTYGSTNVGNKRKILVEYSQPNPNKAMHVGHARNNFLGSSLSKILAFSGYDVIQANYVNNWGVHICKSMLMYQKFGEGKSPDMKSDHFVGKYYAMFESEVVKNPKLAEEAQELFRKLEAKDPETVELWKKVTGWALDGWKKTYADQLIDFDLWQYQSNYVDEGKEITKIALSKGVAEKDPSGAVVARLEKYGIPDKVLLRSDGTSIYSTQDLQLAKDSMEKLGLYKRLYVVDYRQSDYFKQVFKILDILGFSWAKDLVHVAYGMVSLPEGKMSSRTGVVVNADDVFDKLIELELKELGKRDDVADKKEVAKIVALAAFKYPMLKVDSMQNIVFDYNKVTQFEGDTGPYLLYTYARANSVLIKAGSSPLNLTPGDDLSDSELALIRNIYQFEEAIDEAARNLAPSVLCGYLYDLCQKFNHFYNSDPILSSPDPTKNRRLLITKATSQVLNTGLNLLGIPVVEKM